MLKEIIESLHTWKIDGLASAFRRVGRIGFWAQVVLGSFPVILMLYVFTFSGNVSGTRAGLPIVEYLTVANLLLLFFTTAWFYRYGSLSRKIADPATRPTETAVAGAVWTGLVASSLGIIFSIAVMMIDVGQLLFYFLAAPQGGIPTLQTTSVGGSWVSAVDLASLMALVMTLAAEVVATVLGLWLLFRTTQSYDALAK